MNDRAHGASRNTVLKRPGNAMARLLDEIFGRYKQEFIGVMRRELSDWEKCLA